jgi:hypothetical protein
MNNYTKYYLFVLLLIFSQQIAEGKFRMSPTITSFNSSGCVGTDITISGNHFTSTTGVSINSVVATFTVNSNMEIVATVPVGSDGVGTISITNANGTTVSGTSFISIALPTGTPTITTPNGTTFCAGGSIDIEANGVLNTNEAFQWYKNSVTMPGENDATLSVSVADNYSLSILNTVTSCETTQSANTPISESPLPIGTPTITTPNGTVFCAGNMLDIEANGTLGVNEQYQWYKDNIEMAGENNATLSISAGGDYSLSIQNTVTSCQTAQSTFEIITENPNPAGVPTITTPNGTAFCAGGSIDIEANGALNTNEAFQWYKNSVTMAGENDATLSVSVADNYSLSILNTVTSCETTQSANTPISESPLPTGTPTITTPNGIAFCAGNMLDIVANGTLGVNEQYQWYKDNIEMAGENNAALSISAGGDYSLSIQNTVTSCQTAQSTTETITENLNPSQPTITLVRSNSFCDGEDALLVAPSGLSVYNWFKNGIPTGGNTQTLEVTTAGNYTLQVENGSGCESIASIATIITVNPNPTVNAGGDVDICEGQSVNLNAVASGGDGGPYTYSWSPSTGLSNDGIQNPVATPSVTTVYEVEVTDGNTCSVFGDIQITVKDTPFVSLVSSDIDNEICEGDEIAFTATGPAGTEFRFFVDGTPQGTFSTTNIFTTSTLVLGTRNITVSGRINGCIVTTNPIVTTVNASAIVTIDYPTQTSFTVDRDTVILIGSPAGGTFSGNGVANDVFYVSVADVGIHQITYSFDNGNGCISETSTDFTVSTTRSIALDPEYCQNAVSIVLDSTDVPASLGAGPATELIALTVLGGSPAGSLVKDPSRKSWTINPSLFNARTYFFIATYQDISIPSTTSRFASVIFKKIPSVAIQNLKSSYCYENAVVFPTISQSSGTFVWTGVDAGANTASPELNLGDAVDKFTTRNTTVEITYTASNGCSYSDSKAVVINGLPTATISGLDATYCYNASTSLLTSGDTSVRFTGDGITDMGDGTANFSPRDAYFDALLDSTDDLFATVDYTVRDNNGCMNEFTESTTVNGLPNPDFEEPDANYCVNADEIDLLDDTPISIGSGVYSGLGVTDNGDGGTGVFNPTNAFNLGGGTSPGSTTITIPITYTFEDLNNCVNSITKEVLVTPLPVVSFTGLANEYCYSDSLISLVGNPRPIVSGDSDFGYFGHGMVEDTLNGGASYSPQETIRDAFGEFEFIGVTPFVDTIYYVFKDAFGCVNYDSQFVTINPLPDLAITGATDGDEFCYSASNFQLVGSPSDASGSFFGEGVSDNGDGTADYSPKSAADHIGIASPNFTSVADDILYNYTDVNGCSNQEEITLIINGLPSVEILGLDTEYCVNEDDPIEFNGTPRPSTGGDGTFTGVGVFDNTDGTGTFNPRIAVPSDTVDSTPTTHPIIYTFESNEGCIASDTFNVLVRTLPAVDFSASDNSFDYCYNSGNIMLTGNPTPDLVLNEEAEFESRGLISSSPNGTAVYSPRRAADASGVTGESDRTVMDMIFYKLEDQFGCENEIGKAVTIKPIPIVNITDFQIEYCYNSDLDTLTGSPLPSVGISSLFAGSGIIDLGNGTATFNPALAAGSDSTVLTTTHMVTYTHTDNENCSNSTQVNLQVNPLPAVSISTTASTTMCYSATPILLVGSPRTATEPLQSTLFTGFGVSDNGDGTALFDPKQAIADAGITDNTAGIEDYFTKYTYTNAKGCSSSSEIKTTVLPLPKIFFTITNSGVNGNSKEYCPETPTFELKSSLEENGSNSFALFSGDAVVDGIDGKATFNPFQAANLRGDPNTNFSDTTQHVIQLLYTNSSLCSNTVSDTFIVNPKPVASFKVGNNCGSDPTIFNGEGLTNTSVADWGWDFGDNTLAVLQNTSHQYASSGKFDVSLMIATDKGCQDTVVSQVTVGGKPVADFSFIRICLNDSVFFTDLSKVENVSVDTLTNWSWFFDDPASSFSNTSINQNPKREFSDVGDYDVQFVATTNNNCSDTITKRVTILPVVPVNEFPYFEDFEAGNGSWVAGGVNSSWEHGEPNGTNISFTPDGNNAWMTSLSSTYNENEASYVNGPCFDLRAMERPMVSMKIRADTDGGRDGAVLQYSTDDGIVWKNLGDLSSPYNWYNERVEDVGLGDSSKRKDAWSGQYDDWRTARHQLDNVEGGLARFRVRFGSDAAPDVADGFAFDEFWVGERSKMVLLEQFTNSSNVADASINLSIHSIDTFFTRMDLATIQYHVDSDEGKQLDPFHEYNKADPSARALFYGVSSTPSVVVNGNVLANVATELRKNLIIEESLGDEDLLGEASFSLELEFEEQPFATLNVKANLTANKAISGELLVQFAVIEKKIELASPTANGEEVFRWVLRKLLPDAAGTSFNKTWTVGETATVSHSWEQLNVTDNGNQIAVVAFIQRNDVGSNEAKTREVLQAAYGESSLRPPVVTGIEKLPAELLNTILYPNPTSQKANILFGGVIKSDLNWKLVNQLGQIVSNGKIQKGSNGFELETSKLPFGIYIVQVGGEQGKLLHLKMMVIH